MKTSTKKAKKAPSNRRGHNAVKGLQGFQPTAPKPEASKNLTASAADRPLVVTDNGLTEQFGERLLALYPDAVFVDVELLMSDQIGDAVVLTLRDAEGVDMTPPFKDPAFIEFTDRVNSGELFTDEDKDAFVAKNEEFIEGPIEFNGDPTYFLIMKNVRIPGSQPPRRRRTYVNANEYPWVPATDESPASHTVSGW